MRNTLQQYIIDAKNGEQKSMVYLIDKFMPLIKKSARILNYEEAETDMIISLIEVIYHIDLRRLNDKSEGKLVSYIHNCMKNKRVDLFRKNIKHALTYIELNQDILEGQPYNYENSLLFKSMLHAVTELQRKILISKYLYGYSDSDSEISKMIGISRQAVNRTKNRALRSLRSKFRIVS